MTQEEKQLLLKDLCARVPYGVICACEKYNGQLKFVCPDGDYCVLQISPYAIETVKPYLRPMSSMTEEEKRELAEEQKKDEELFLYIIHKSQEGDDSLLGTAIPHYAEDWANKNHFDYRGLIPMGLALEAPEGMYK